MTQILRPRNDAVRGVIRSVVQVFASAVLAYGPVNAVLDTAGLELTEGQVTAFLVPIVMALYWYAGNALQHWHVVENNPALRWIVAVGMGGFEPPAYGEPGADYSVVHADGTETSLMDYIDGQFGA